MSEFRYEISYGPDDSTLQAWLIDCQTRLPSFRASKLASAPETKDDGTFVRSVLIDINLPEDEALQEIEERFRRNGLAFRKL